MKQFNQSILLNWIREYLVLDDKKEIELLKRIKNHYEEYEDVFDDD